MYIPLVLPLQCPLAQDVNETSQEKANEQDYRHETIPAQSFEIDRVGIKEDDLHVKEHEKDRDQKILDGHRLSGIPLLFDTTFEGLQLVCSSALRTKEMGDRQHDGHKQKGEKDLQSDRKVVGGSTLRHRLGGLCLQKNEVLHDGPVLAAQKYTPSFEKQTGTEKKTGRNQ